MVFTSSACVGSATPADASIASDSGAANDAGSRTDAGSDTDAGSPSDAGSLADTGSASAIDGGTRKVTVGGITVTLTGGSKPVAFPFDTWDGARVAVSPSGTGTTYYVNAAAGVSGNGKTLGAAFRTLGEAVAVVAAGDTVLIKAGLYRELLDLSGISGTTGKPITFGAIGDGEVIIDHSPKVTGWSRVAAGSSVWKVSFPTSSGAVDAVVVNDVPLARYKTTTVPPAMGSGEWALPTTPCMPTSAQRLPMRPT